MPHHYSEAELIDGLRRAFIALGATFTLKKAAEFTNVSAATLAARLGGTYTEALRRAGIPWPLPKPPPPPKPVVQPRKSRPEPVIRDLPKVDNVFTLPAVATQGGKNASEPKPPVIAREDRPPPPGATLEEMSVWFSGPGLRLAAENYALDSRHAQTVRQIAETVKILRQTLGTDKSQPVPQSEITIKRAIIPDNGRDGNVVNFK